MMGIVMTSQIPLHATLMVETVVELTLTHTIVMCAHVLKKLIVHQQQVCINILEFPFLDFMKYTFFFFFIQDDSHLCHETTRRILLQLMMIKWGLFGLGDGTAGTFLANHYSILGPYFGNTNGNDWPHSPFVNEPTPLELDFNEKMMKITEMMSNGTLENVSILDLPAFGSSVARLDKHHRMMSNWPTEVNFEILKHNEEDRLVLLTEYKNLLDDWENYMIKAKSLYISHTGRNSEIEIWAGFGPVGNTEEKIGPL